MVKHKIYAMDTNISINFVSSINSATNIAPGKLAVTVDDICGSVIPLALAVVSSNSV